jgi:hypothetical protein
MTKQSRTVLESALQLPPAQRAEVAAQLIASLDGNSESGAEQAWASEVEQRARRVLVGDGKSSDWDTVRSRAERSLDKL